MANSLFRTKKRYFDIGGGLSTNLDSIGSLGSGGAAGSVGMQNMGNFNSGSSFNFQDILSMFGSNGSGGGGNSKGALFSAIGNSVSATGAFLSSIAELVDKPRKPLNEVVFGNNNNKYDVGGYMNIGTTALGLVGNAINQAQIEDTEGLKDSIKAYGNQVIEANSTNDLLDKWESTTPINNISWKDLRDDSLFQDFSNSLITSGQGFSAGSVGGPWGAAIGGVVGGLSSVIGSLVGRRKAKREAKKVNNLINEANDRVNRSFENASNNLTQQTNFDYLTNYAAYGGPLTMRYSGTMSPFGNRFAEGGGIHIKKKNRGKFTDYCGGKVTSECIQRGLHSSNPTTRKRANFARNARKWHSFGGWLNTQGGDFTNGLTYIDNGGTHEQNPNEGVQMGVDQQGTPNLVEEGEVVFNDYVFSNRIKVPKELKKKYKIHGNTFAEAAKELSKESEERPNDPISKRGLNSFMNILADSQEELRIHKSMRESNKYKKGGRLFAYAGSLESPYSYGNELLNKSNIDTTPYYRSGSDYMNKYNYILNNWDSPYVQSFIKDVYIPSVESYNKSRGYNTSFTVNRDQFKAGAHDKQWGGMHEGVLKFEIPESGNTPSLLDIKDVEGLLDLNDDIPELNPTISDLRRGTSNKSKVKNIRQNPLRYAPIVGSGIAVLNDLLGGNKPDYSNAGLFSQAIDNSYNPIGYRPLGDYLVYKPFDRDYYINKLNADSAASRRAIQNTSGGNRAAQMAGILASNYNYGNQLGALARQAEEYNMAQRERVRTFNRATNMFNSEQGTKVDMFNAEGAGKKAALYGKLAEMRQRILDANRAEKSLNLTNFLQGLGDLGRELTDRDIIRWMGDTGTLSYNTKGEYTGGSKKNGGKLKRKKGFTV